MAAVKHIKYDIDELKRLLFDENKTYKEVGRIYGVSDVTIRKYLIKHGVKIETRSNRNKKFCPICGKEMTGQTKWANIYCSQSCAQTALYKKKITEWKDGKWDGGIGKEHHPSKFIRRYLMEKYNETCQVPGCGCNWKNPISGLSILQIHHIDGDCTNNKEENLQLLCPNHHTMTDNYCRLNEKSSRKRKIIYKD